MGRVRTSILLPGRIADAEALWYDTARRPSWVDGFHHVVRLRGDWPQSGSELMWDSVPGGRGRVVERVKQYEQRAGQAVQVEEQRLRGIQRVAFTAHGTREVEVALELEYELKQPGGPIGVVVDALFVRRLVGDSLRRTLSRFARELDSDRSPL